MTLTVWILYHMTTGSYGYDEEEEEGRGSIEEGRGGRSVRGGREGSGMRE